MKKNMEKTSIILIVFSFFIIATALMFPRGEYGVPGPGFFPGIIGFLMLVLSLILLKEEIGDKKVKEPIIKKAYKNTYLSMFITLIYLLTLEKIGFIVMTPIYLFTIIRLFSYKKIKNNLLVSTLATLAIYYLFSKLLNVPLSLGILSF